jgi:glutathione S-transferase
MMQITLFHLPNSRSQRIVWLLEELNLNYELNICDQNAPQAKMKFPTVQIEQHGKIQQLSESSAIAEYLCQLEQKLVVLPSDQDYWHYCFYKNFADASFMPNLALKQVFAQIAQQTPWPVRFISLAFKVAFNRVYLNPVLDQQLQILNRHFMQYTWLAGDKFSSADILLWFPLLACEFAHAKFSDYPALAQYLKQIKSRPAFQTALQKGHWSAEEFQRYWQITQ